MPGSKNSLPDKDLNKSACNTLDTSQPRREEEVIEQTTNKSHHNLQQPAKENGEKRFKEGLQDNSNTGE